MTRQIRENRYDHQGRKKQRVFQHSAPARRRQKTIGPATAAAGSFFQAAHANPTPRPYIPTPSITPRAARGRRVCPPPKKARGLAFSDIFQRPRRRAHPARAPCLHNVCWNSPHPWTTKRARSTPHPGDTLRALPVSSRPAPSDRAGTPPRPTHPVEVIKNERGSGYFFKFVLFHVFVQTRS